MSREEPAEDRSDNRDEAPPPPVITDARTMRALAHPLRLALLEAIQTEGELTATQAAELLDESPGNMSWHLQTLAKYGFIEEAGGAKGRSRPWRISTMTNRFMTDEDDPGSHAAGKALVMTIFERNIERAREWWSIEHTFDQRWQDASFMTDSVKYLTAEETSELNLQIHELTSKFDKRTDKKLRPEGSMPVHFSAYAHPLPPNNGMGDPGNA